VSAIDVDRGEVETVVGVGGPFVAPDDLAFDSHGTMYVTDYSRGQVIARSPSGEVTIVAESPGANGIAIHEDRIFIDECRPEGRLYEILADGSISVLLEGLEWPNALAMGPDGRLYYPLVRRGEVWSVDANGGEAELFVSGIEHPTAVKLDSQGRVTVVEGGSGDVLAFDIQSRARKTVATAEPGLDNLAFLGDRLFVSNYADASVIEVTGDRKRAVVEPTLVRPHGIAVASDGELYVADGMSIAAIGRDGSIRRLTWRGRPGYPHFVRGLCSGLWGEVHITDVGGKICTYNVLEDRWEVLAEGLREPTGIARDVDGSLLVAETGAGRLCRITGTGEIHEVAAGLGRPLDVALAADGSLFVSDQELGRVLRLSPDRAVMTDGLVAPNGLAVAGDQLFVVDRDRKQLVVVSISDGTSKIVASGLAVGSPVGTTAHLLPGNPDAGIPAILPFAGVAAAPDGTIYVAGDGEGSILEFRASDPRHRGSPERTSAISV
jgi:sugar lactone lactonase YvrE